ncbi:MAG: rhomboid family intramembrane serine protease [Planctomycetes bacterium]|nr:rhomboid family intramembrane serine protease [Planctomycetota bacterium]
MLPLRDTIPSRSAPLVVWLLVLVNALVFAFELSLRDGELEVFIAHFGVVPVRMELSAQGLLAAPLAYLPLFTSVFLHGGWLHVLGNLWVLWIFGDNVEDRMGHGRFLAFYLLCGVLAGAVHVYFSPQSSVPTIGASGAISGVMGAYLVLYPRAKVITLIPILFYPLFVELPAFVFLGVWFASQLLSGTASLVAPEEAGGIAFLAHVGGFVAGLLLHVLFVQRRRG